MRAAACVALELVLCVGALASVQRAGVEYRLGRISFVGPSGMVRDEHGWSIGGGGAQVQPNCHVSSHEVEPAWFGVPSPVVIGGVDALEEKAACIAPGAGGSGELQALLDGCSHDRVVRVWFPSQQVGVSVGYRTFEGLGDWLVDCETNHWLRRIVDSLAFEAER